MGYRFDPYVIWNNLSLLAQGALMTLAISAISIMVGLLIGSICASIKMSKITVLNKAVTVYVEIFRATPFLVQVYFIFLALPQLSIRLNSLQAGLVGLSLYSGAYLTEILRAGFESVPQSQTMTAMSLGFNKWQSFRYVVFPQAVKNIMPPLGNQFIDTTLTSSVAAFVGVNELTQLGKVIDSKTFRPFEAYFAVGVIYLIITQLLLLLFSRLTKWFGAGRGVKALPTDIELASTSISTDK
jgi:His/Glu/Gln/Arg/opine family amino acid ABC transporter permease subunit